MSRKFHLFTSLLDLHTSELFFELLISQRHIQNFEYIYTKLKSVYISQLFRRICKFLNFTGSLLIKILKLSKREYNSLYKKVNFSIIDPAHITIYGF